MINTLKFYQDFPKEGIKFVDIIPLLQNKAVYKQLIDRLTELTTAANVAAPEARGFLFASPLLLTSEKVQNIIPIRKSGKLPFNEGDLIEVRIEKEYGFDTLYYRRSDIGAGVPEGDVFEVTLFDDVLAHGLAHDAESDKTDFHSLDLLCSLCRDQLPAVSSQAAWKTPRPWLV